jgi:hypothetical protein
MEWNSWTETTDLSTARGYLASAGANNSNALAAGGSPDTAVTEEWTGAGSPTTQTITTS